jgi:hypothetical protein
LETYPDALLISEPVPLSVRIATLISDMHAEWRELDRRIAEFDAEFAVGRANAFRRGRDMAAWLGLVPKQLATGGKPRLLGISKRGNLYLRKLLIHGARAALPSLSKSETPLGAWLRGLLSRVHTNVALVALANQLARIAWAVLRWAVLRTDQSFERKTGAATGQSRNNRRADRRARPTRSVSGASEMA